MKPIPIKSATSHRPPSARRSRLEGVRNGGGTVSELIRLLVAQGRWWLVPLLIMLGLTALLLVAVAAVEYVAPFVYTIF